MDQRQEDKIKNTRQEFVKSIHDEILKFLRESGKQGSDQEKRHDDRTGKSAKSFQRQLIDLINKKQ